MSLRFPFNSLRSLRVAKEPSGCTNGSTQEIKEKNPRKHPWMRKLMISNLVEKKYRHHLEEGLSWRKDLVGQKGMMIMMMIMMTFDGLLSRCSTAKLSGDRGKRGKMGAKQRKVSRFHNSRVEEQDGVFRREKNTHLPLFKSWSCFGAIAPVDGFSLAQSQ